MSNLKERKWEKEFDEQFSGSVKMKSYDSPRELIDADRKDIKAFINSLLLETLAEQEKVVLGALPEPFGWDLSLRPTSAETIEGDPANEFGFDVGIADCRSSVVEAMKKWREGI